MGDRTLPGLPSHSALALQAGGGETHQTPRQFAGADGRPLWVEFGAAVACLRSARLAAGRTGRLEELSARTTKDSAEVLLAALETGQTATPLSMWEAYFEAPEAQGQIHDGCQDLGQVPSPSDLATSAAAASSEGPAISTDQEVVEWTPGQAQLAGAEGSQACSLENFALLAACLFAMQAGKGPDTNL